MPLVLRPEVGKGYLDLSPDPNARFVWTSPESRPKLLWSGVEVIETPPRIRTIRYRSGKLSSREYEQGLALHGPAKTYRIWLPWTYMLVSVTKKYQSVFQTCFLVMSRKRIESLEEEVKLYYPPLPNIDANILKRYWICMGFRNPQEGNDISSQTHEHFWRTTFNDEIKSAFKSFLPKELLTPERNWHGSFRKWERLSRKGRLHLSWKRADHDKGPFQSLLELIPHMYKEVE